MNSTSFKRFMVAIWPTVYRIVNQTLYFFLSVIKNIVSGIFKQLKGGF